jgi:hypothetical protein
MHATAELLALCFDSHFKILPDYDLIHQSAQDKASIFVKAIYITTDVLWQ